MVHAVDFKLYFINLWQNHVILEIMDDTIEIPVNYKNKDLIFEAKFLQLGYSYKFEIDVNGTTVFLEPDEERNFRAIVVPSIEHRHNNVDKELIQAIAESLEAILK